MPWASTKATEKYPLTFCSDGTEISGSWCFECFQNPMKITKSRTTALYGTKSISAESTHLVYCIHDAFVAIQSILVLGDQDFEIWVILAFREPF